MAATPDGEVPLKILSMIPEFEERVLPPPKGFPESDPRIYRVSLRNDSERIITAWRFSCLFASNEGRHGTVSLEEDGFRAFERKRNRVIIAWDGFCVQE
ncbi:MAG: hypothetical protein GY856_35595 [bacterium]|nr:hypothetical protein [bacterium]